MNISLISEWRLLARLGLSRMILLFQSRREDASFLPFYHSILAAFPGLSESEARSLHLRRKSSRKKFALILDFLTNSPKNGLISFVKRHVDIDGYENLAGIADDDCPVIFVTPHYGTFPLGCMKLILGLGHKKIINTFYDPPSKIPTSAGFQELFGRIGFGFNALFNDNMAVLKALRVLNRGEALTMMPDVFDLSSHPIYVPFFGRLVPAMGGAALFALKGRAKVFIVYSCPRDGLRTTIKVGRPLEFASSDNLEKDITRLTSMIFRDMEAQYRVEPEHWVYIDRIGNLLNRKLEVGFNDSTQWFDAADKMLPLFSTAIPELKEILQEFKENYLRDQVTSEK